ncbi:hypothetical protein LSH36_664g01039 [Paralvinella palmiformis]|uniref:Glycosyltransferase family 92 protein n=1 Tax=Paralvinella palmiformis TaxID=53620 RepID=A0AAD9MVS8_9ANNE|nr:hypothetical protein LSH36_664g01039 [Paralvinella palmiformis]
MKHLDRLRTGSTRSRGTRGAFLFRNAFFRIDWPDEGADRSADEQLRLKTLLKLRREDEIWPFYQRTKYILVPKAVLQIGIHYVFEFVHSGINHKEVPADVALLHHYREWSGNNSGTLGVVDKEMLRFADPLRQSVRAVHRTLGLVDIKSRRRDIRRVEFSVVYSIGAAHTWDIRLIDRRLPRESNSKKTEMSRMLTHNPKVCGTAL